jgi:hypothetical protein
MFSLHWQALLLIQEEAAHGYTLHTHTHTCLSHSCLFKANWGSKHLQAYAYTLVTMQTLSTGEVMWSVHTELERTSLPRFEVSESGWGGSDLIRYCLAEW